MLDEATGGKQVTVDEALTCSLLVDGKCSAYENRPTICRLYGAVPEMRCLHGCTPPLSSAQGREIFHTVMDVGEDVRQR